MNHSVSSLLVWGLACLVFSATFTSTVAARPLPPGPRIGWFSGVKLPKAYQWLTYAKWRHIYGKYQIPRPVRHSNFPLLGDIIYLRIFGNPIMVINSAQVAEDLLERRSKTYSSRYVPAHL